MEKGIVWLPASLGPSRRITLPKGLAKQLGWLKGAGRIEAWILTLEAGRYRLIPNSQFEKDPELKQTLERFNPVQPDTPETPFEAESPESAVLPSRLLPVTISPPPPSLRLLLSNVPLLDSNGEEIKILIPMLSEGYVELWSARRFAAAQNAPIQDLLV